VPVPVKLPHQRHDALALQLSASAAPLRSFEWVARLFARKNPWFNAAGARAAVTISSLWHPRLDADAAHRWLRGVVLSSGMASR
jgi:hypothetical protein